MDVPIPIPINISPVWEIVKPRLMIKIIGNASNTGKCVAVRFQTKEEEAGTYMRTANHIL